MCCWIVVVLLSSSLSLSSSRYQYRAVIVSYYHRVVLSLSDCQDKKVKALLTLVVVRDVETSVKVEARHVPAPVNEQQRMEDVVQSGRLFIQRRPVAFYTRRQTSRWAVLWPPRSFSNTPVYAGSSWGEIDGRVVGTGFLPWFRRVPSLLSVPAACGHRLVLVMEDVYVSQSV